jgi:hypothetical protein
MRASSDTPLGSRVGLIPVAADGSVFDSSCAHADGSYRVGPKGGELVVASYDVAVEQLRTMPVAYWRRPSAGSGRLGIVRAVDWVSSGSRPGQSDAADEGHSTPPTAPWTNHV